jgi:hypothetical protein
MTSSTSSTEVQHRLQGLLDYHAQLRGDEKGESQVFLDRLFQAFGHGGYKEAGAVLEFRVPKQGRGTKFADLIWGSRVLIEMKKRGEKLQEHYLQAFEYWIRIVPNRPRYVVMCNFDEFWVYDFNTQLDEPLDRIPIADLPERYMALAFLFPDDRTPLLGNNRVEVTREAADSVATVLNSLIARGEERSRVQRFMLQCVLAMFAEDFDLIPRGFFTQLADDARKGLGSTYDLFGGLFRQMNNPEPARGGRFVGIPYFNGGLFSTVDPLDLNGDELHRLHLAALENNWAKIQPQIFGVLFQSSMGRAERHARGAHYTSEADIMRVVLPTVVRPWQARIEAASNQRELRSVLEGLHSFRVLDPACGSGNFLYVAYRELKRLEANALLKFQGMSGRDAARQAATLSAVSVRQMYGIEFDSFGAELAKVTLTLAKELALREMHGVLGSSGLDFDQPLPLDNLDANIIHGDALFTPWPEVEAIIGNPPFQSKNKMQREFGSAYVRRVRDTYPLVPGRADYCVYWIRKAHDHLRPGQRAGLVGTNTIRQNDSRVGGLDHVVAQGGTITDAVSSQVWSGDAAVHVSIVNWVKGDAPGLRHLAWQTGSRPESPWEEASPASIGAALSAGTDVTSARSLRVNVESEACYQGQTHGHEGFLIDPVNNAELLRQLLDDPKAKRYLHPYLIADELIGRERSLPGRFVLDLNSAANLFEAMEAGKAFERLQQTVEPAMRALAEQEREDTGRERGPRQNHYDRWWRFWRGRAELIGKLSKIPRYIACGQVAMRPIFEFIDSEIRPNAALIVFPLPDDYSFGILQSSLHWAWIKVRGSTLTERFRYTSDTIFDSFPWPQEPSSVQIQAVAAAAVALRTLRREVMNRQGWSLRDLYRTLDTPGRNPLREAQEVLDTAVRAAYGMPARADRLTFLLALNKEVAEKESEGEVVIGPGLPPSAMHDVDRLVTEDRVQPLGRRLQNRT